MQRDELRNRVAVAAVVAIAVLGLTVLVAPSPPPAHPDSGQLNYTEYDQSRELDVLPSEGTVEADAPPGEGETVIIDESHANRVEETTIQPLVRALVDLGYEVEFSTENDLGEALEGASALVVVDPAQSYSDDEVREIRNFTDAGGRLVVLTEPDRKRITANPFGGFQLSTLRSQTGSLTRAYGITVDRRYLYNQQHNDGSYRAILGESTDDAAFDADPVALDTAAPIYAPDADPLLVGAEGTRLSSTDAAGEYNLAVRADNVVVVGDKSFLTPDRYRIGDNEALVAYLVTFLAEGEPYEPTEQNGPDGPGQSVDGSPSSEPLGALADHRAGW